MPRTEGIEVDLDNEEIQDLIVDLSTDEEFIEIVREVFDCEVFHLREPDGYLLSRLKQYLESAQKRREHFL